MRTLKMSSKEPVPSTHCLPQEARAAGGLGLGTAGLTLDAVWGCAQERVCRKQLDERVRPSLLWTEAATFTAPAPARAEGLGSPFPKESSGGGEFTEMPLP